MMMNNNIQSPTYILYVYFFCILHDCIVFPNFLSFF